MITYWTDEQLSEFGRKLEGYHRLFTVFWSMASISFTDNAAYCPTAMVYLKGKPRMTILKPWWDKLSDKMRVFVVVHECLHAMLKHGLRNGKVEVPNATHDQVNRAQDITINEMAESLFGIPRTDLDDWKKYCWIATCFPGDPTVLPNETFIYYLKRLVAKGDLDLPDLMDQHPGDELFAPAEDDMRDEDDFNDELFDVLTDEELEAMEKACGGGQGAGYGFGGYLTRKEAKAKLRVSKLIKGFKSAAAASRKPLDTFVSRGRRFATMPDSLFLPNAHDSKRGPQKFRIALCLDVSGSVVHLRPQFYALRELFLKEKELLECKSYVFADRIAEIEDENQPYDVGGGNDPFQIIERKITKPPKGKKEPPPYPDCVIVITDGGAGPVNPKHPKRWLWLMTDSYVKESIPRESRIVKISDVIFD